MTDVPSEPVGSSEIVEGPTPAGGVKALILKDASGAVREVQEIDANDTVIQRTYLTPPSSLDR